MNGSFTRGLIVGGIIAASISMAMNPQMMRNKNRKKIMRSGRTLLRRSGNVLGDVVDMFR
jgi:gas vesicle protein